MEIKRKNTSIKVRNHTDVLVVGGGPSGFGAAISAARAGAQVSLVEYGGMLGGMWTLGLLSPFFDNANKGGLNRELREELKVRNAWGGLWNISFDPVEMAMILDEYALKYKLDLMLQSLATDVVMDGNELKGVIVENKSGSQAVMADIVIDCSGDGDIAARAGAPFEKGRMQDGFMQPMTMMFKIGGLSDKYPHDNLKLWYDEMLKIIPEKELLSGIPFNNPALIRLPRPGEALIQWTHVYKHDATNGDELSSAIMEGRRQVRKAMEFFKTVKGLIGDVYLLDIPAVLGVRESRRISGEYVISDSDVLNGKRHRDGICNVSFNVDIHEPGNEKQTLVSHSGFDIPYRSLIPLKVENILTAGRCISGSHMAHAAYRVTGDCLASGEAAGYAAAEAVRKKQSVRSIDGAKLAEQLKQKDYDGK
ncbi:MAG: hypothetical protein A2X49_02295 [Lentisphaerae bacterium GWF2_52_8]|nr:MAG: hypothetical protein A2X49_02295 [Lentisphaerae bacterium GWF2_52_8]